jgi:SagB-type dehydrogenase family enzyme
MSAPPPQTVRWAEWVYGRDGVSHADAAEEYHEASKLSAATADHRVRGGRLLEFSAEMRASAARAVKRYRHVPRIDLPPPRLPPATLADLIVRRRSRREFGPEPVRLDHLGTLLSAAYGVTASLDPGQPVRAVPSGGALYPLELYVAASSVSGLEPGLYHFDPFRTALERLRAFDPRPALRPLSPYGELLTAAGAVVFVTAMFWRSRFKYGLRGYRFALLEAGHLGQNLLLAATALDLASLPVGGVYDRRVDEFLSVDGVNESVVYAFSLGTRPA